MLQCVAAFYSLLHCQIVFHYTDAEHFIYLFTEQFNYVAFQAIMNSATKDIYVQSLHVFSFLLGKYVKVELLGHMVKF